MKEFLDEYDYLIHLIRCAIHNEQPQEMPDEFSFEKVYQFGVFHHVSNIAFYSIKKLAKKPDADLYHEWEACCDRAVIREFTQSYARDEIISGFQQANIRWLEVQGTKLKALYPQPEYRTMSDLDFIVDLEKLSRAKDVLLKLGYTCTEIEGVEVDGFRAPNINIEVHTEYFPQFFNDLCVMRPPFASIEETGEYDINELYLYNMLHIAKHYQCSGFGIRRVLDAYYLNKNYAERIDRQYVKSVFEKAKVADFIAELSTLANQWFADEPCDAERSDMARLILDSGLHGTRRNAMIIQMKSKYDGNRFFKIKYLLRRVFADNSIMYVYYPFLKRWKILYPFCWIHRIIRTLRISDIKRIADETKTLISTDFKR